MFILKKNPVVEIIFGIVLVFYSIHGGNSKEHYQVNINERGTEFNESIAIDDVEKTVIYNVPSHNEIKKTDVLVDYKNGHFVTRIPEREVCYIKPLATANEQSLRETRKSLELLHQMKTQSNATVPIKIVETITTIKREIPREELSKKVAEFCGSNTPYEVKEEVITRKKGQAKTKRSSSPITIHFVPLPPTYTKPSGAIVTCDKTKDHWNKIVECARNGRKANIGCGLTKWGCRYIANCVTGPIPTLATGCKRKTTIIKHYMKCTETHTFSSMWCCDVVGCA